jgi:hypothetical protein
MSGRQVSDEFPSPCPQPPAPSPDAIANREEQRAGSAIMNTVYEYEQISGKKYRFKNNKEYLLFKMGKIRQGNILADPVKYVNSPSQSAITNIDDLRNL